ALLLSGWAGTFFEGVFFYDEDPLADVFFAIPFSSSRSSVCASFNLFSGGEDLHRGKTGASVVTTRMGVNNDPGQQHQHGSTSPPPNIMLLSKSPWSWSGASATWERTGTDERRSNEADACGKTSRTTPLRLSSASHGCGGTEGQGDHTGNMPPKRLGASVPLPSSVSEFRNQPDCPLSADERMDVTTSTFRVRFPASTPASCRSDESPNYSACTTPCGELNTHTPQIEQDEDGVLNNHISFVSLRKGLWRFFNLLEEESASVAVGSDQQTEMAMGDLHRESEVELEVGPQPPSSPQGGIECTPRSTPFSAAWTTGVQVTEDGARRNRLSPSSKEGALFYPQDPSSRKVFAEHPEVAGEHQNRSDREWTGINRVAGKEDGSARCGPPSDRSRPSHTDQCQQHAVPGLSGEKGNGASWSENVHERVCPGQHEVNDANSVVVNTEESAEDLGRFQVRSVTVKTPKRTRREWLLALGLRRVFSKGPLGALLQLSTRRSSSSTSASGGASKRAASKEPRMSEGAANDGPSGGAAREEADVDPSRSATSSTITSRGPEVHHRTRSISKETQSSNRPPSSSMKTRNDEDLGQHHGDDDLIKDTFVVPLSTETRTTTTTSWTTTTTIAWFEAEKRQVNVSTLQRARSDYDLSAQFVGEEDGELRLVQVACDMERSHDATGGREHRLDDGCIRERANPALPDDRVFHVHLLGEGLTGGRASSGERQRDDGYHGPGVTSSAVCAASLEPTANGRGVRTSHDVNLDSEARTTRRPSKRSASKNSAPRGRKGRSTGRPGSGRRRGGRSDSGPLDDGNLLSDRRSQEHSEGDEQQHSVEVSKEWTGASTRGIGKYTTANNKETRTGTDRDRSRQRPPRPRAHHRSLSKGPASATPSVSRPRGAPGPPPAATAH
ncbi:unnamed protein product, partial [Amoebophrya sp. A25]